jgi:hypothetical protein
LNSSNPNRTLGCGFLDKIDNIFKFDGVSTAIINQNLVTCLAFHLTAFSVQEFTADFTSSDVVSTNTTSGYEVNYEVIVDMWKSWSVYTVIGILIMTPLFLLWAYRRD